MTTRLKKMFYVTSMGLFFAILQTSYFFELEIWLTAAYPSFLTIMLGWLLGNVLGLAAGRRLNGGRSPFAILSISLLVSLMAYYLSIFVLKAYPYELNYLPLYAIMIMVSGAQAGHFFSVNRSIFHSSSTLFFLENNGFIAGWIAGFFGFIMYGSGFNLMAPIALGLLSILLSWFVFRPNNGATPANH